MCIYSILACIRFLYFMYKIYLYIARSSALYHPTYIRSYYVLAIPLFLSLSRLRKISIKNTSPLITQFKIGTVSVSLNLPRTPP